MTEIRRITDPADFFVLYGESPARLDEILAWALAYGIDILPAPDDVDQRLPRSE